MNQFLDFKSLKGDSSDNIPGVPGIGEKGALDLLKMYNSLDGVYDNLALVKDSVRKKLEAGKDLAYLSKQLARIWTDAPLKLDLAACDGSNANQVKIAELLQRLEFRSLVRQLPEVMHVPANHLPTERHTTLTVGKHEVIDTSKKLAALTLQEAPQLYIHSRAAGKHGRKPQLLSFSSDGKTVYTLDLTKLSTQAVASALKDLPPLIGYDVKATLKILIELGVSVPAVQHDILVGAFLLNSLRREQSLTELAESDLGYTGSPFDEVDNLELLSRMPEIMAAIQALYEQQKAEFSKFKRITTLAQDIEWPVIPVLARMEYIGIELDTEYLAVFADQINDLISDYEQQIYGFADQEFNIGSPVQLADILFEKLHLPTQGIKKGKTGYSTAASELDKLRGTHPLIDLITQYREVAKLKNTYVDTLPLLTDDNSRVHTTFNLTIAQTGRLSSTDPNLQNIPTRTDLGRNIRTAFIAGPGKYLISADYSQFELRLAAVLAKDDELIDMFNRGADIHTATAAQVYGRELEDVTKQMRRAAKVINFGILYGMSPHGLQIATGMNREQAVDFIDRYKQLRKPLFDYMETIKEKAKNDGYVETLFGRRRPMPDITSSNFIVRQAAERAAINMPIQGTEADLMKLSMIKIDELLKTTYEGCHMLLQIHDSILLECPEAKTTQLAADLKSTMEAVYTLQVRLDVDVTTGKNWGEL